MWASSLDNWGSKGLVSWCRWLTPIWILKGQASRSWGMLPLKIIFKFGGSEMLFYTCSLRLTSWNKINFKKVQNAKNIFTIQCNHTLTPCPLFSLSLDYLEVNTDKVQSLLHVALRLNCKLTKVLFRWVGGGDGNHLGLINMLTRLLFRLTGMACMSAPWLPDFHFVQADLWSQHRIKLVVTFYLEF